jgi:hypothetical protein
MDARSRKHCCRVKAMSITYSVCPQPLLSRIQRACAVLYCFLWPVWLFHIFPHYLINGTFFRQNAIEHKMILDITNVFTISIRYYCKTLMELQFSRKIWKNTQHQISRKSVEWEPSCSTWMDRLDEANCSFPHFCEHAAFPADDKRK